MIDYPLYCKINHLSHNDGLTAQQIAWELSMDVRTIRKWLSETQFKTPPEFSAAQQARSFQKGYCPSARSPSLHGYTDLSTHSGTGLYRPIFHRQRTTSAK